MQKKQIKSLEELSLELEEIKKKKLEFEETLGNKEDLQAQANALYDKFYELEDIDWKIESLQAEIESFKPTNLDLRKEVGKVCMEFRNKLLALSKSKNEIQQIEETLGLFGVSVSEVHQKEFWLSSTHQCRGFSRLETVLDQEVWNYALGEEK